jgi:hypothetical protein
LVFRSRAICIIPKVEAISRLAQGFGSVRTGKRGASQGGRSSDSSKVRIAAPVLGLPRTSEGKKEAGVEFVVVRKNPGLNRARMSYGRWVSRPRNICIIPGIPTPRKGHPRAGFQSSPRGYEELHNPVRAATHYTYPCEPPPPVRRQPRGYIMQTWVGRRTKEAGEKRRWLLPGWARWLEGHAPEPPTRSAGDERGSEPRAP